MNKEKKKLLLGKTNFSITLWICDEHALEIHWTRVDRIPRTIRLYFQGYFCKTFLQHCHTIRNKILLKHIFQTVCTNMPLFQNKFS